MLFKENNKPEINTLPANITDPYTIQADVLRLDQLHPDISGNKWYKLKEYLKEAQRQNKKTIITFGGAFSNHILATAAACRLWGFASVGLIRGELPKTLSPTLIKAAEAGMNLYFLSREEYRNKKIPENVWEQYPDAYVVNEGGYGLPGMQGAQDILKEVIAKKYTHILAATGTGTTLAGLTEAAEKQQQVIGISVLKNNFDLTGQINHLLSAANKNRFQLLHDYHFGGYAKYTSELIGFMNKWYQQTGIPSDFVYTGKLFYAFQHLCHQSFFPAGSYILVIHSGGLQGNYSLNKGTLLF